MRDIYFGGSIVSLILLVLTLSIFSYFKYVDYVSLMQRRQVLFYRLLDLFLRTGNVFLYYSIIVIIITKLTDHPHKGASFLKCDKNVVQDVAFVV